MLNDTGILWRINFPARLVELELLETLLLLSLDTVPYSFPVREHQSRDFDGFVNVEKKLSMITRSFIDRGWLTKAEGPYPAKLAPNVTFEEIGDKFGLDIRSYND